MNHISEEVIILKKRMDSIIIIVALVFSGISFLSGVVAFVIEKFVFPITLDDFKNLYTPLPFHWITQSLIEFIMIICILVNSKVENPKKIILNIVIILISLITAWNWCYFENDTNGFKEINYEYRELYLKINVVVTNIEKSLNFIAFIIILLLYIIKSITRKSGEKQ